MASLEHRALGDLGRFFGFGLLGEGVLIDFFPRGFSRQGSEGVLIDCFFFFWGGVSHQELGSNMGVGGGPYRCFFFFWGGGHQELGSNISGESLLWDDVSRDVSRSQVGMFLQKGCTAASQTSPFRASFDRLCLEHSRHAPLDQVICAISFHPVVGMTCPTKLPSKIERHSARNMERYTFVSRIRGLIQVQAILVYLFLPLFSFLFLSFFICIYIYIYVGRLLVPGNMLTYGSLELHAGLTEFPTPGDSLPPPIVPGP